MQSCLPQYTHNLNFFNEGKPDTFISEHLARLNDSINGVYQQLVAQGARRKIDAFLVFWDTDTSNTVWCGTTQQVRGGGRRLDGRCPVLCCAVLCCCVMLLCCAAVAEMQMLLLLKCSWCYCCDAAGAVAVV